MEVRSALNQTLDAEIDLLSVSADELANLSVGLASAKAFTQAGLDRPPTLSDLKFSLETRADGRHFIKVVSKQPVREPLLNFLVQLDWNRGQLLREFAVLLDPPVFMANVQAPPAAAAPARAPASSPTPERVSRPAARVVAGSEGAAPATKAKAVPPADGDHYGPVAHGETLWGIAKRLRPSPAISVERMMRALLEANPDAFYRPNPDSLNAGAILRVPRLEGVAGGSVAGVPPAEAQQRAEEVASAAAGEAAGSGTESVAQVRLISPETEREEPQAPAADMLVQAAISETLSAPASSGPELAAPLQIRLQADRPQLWVAGLDDLRSRISALVGVDDAALTAIQQSAPSPELGSTRTGADAAAPDAAVAPPAIRSKPAPEKAQPQPAATRLERVAAPPTQAAGFWESLAAWRDNPIRTALIAGGLLLGGLSAMVLVRRRRRPQPDEMEEEPAFEPVLLADSETAVVPPASPAAGQRPKSAEPAPAPRLHPVPVSMERVNLLIAVGNYREAENTVRLALAEDPTNVALTVKLLDILSATRNAEGFLEQAELLHDRLEDKSDPRWLHVMEMGHELCPGDPLFTTAGEPTRIVGPWAEPADDAAQGMDFHVPVRPEEPAEESRLSAGDVMADTLDRLEWQPSMTAPEGPAAVRAKPAARASRDAAAGDDLEAHLRSLDSDLDAPAPAHGEAADGEPQEEEMSLLAQSPLFDPLTPADGKGMEDLEAHLRSLSFEPQVAGEGAPGPQGGTDTERDRFAADDFVETKLDLAMAYLDMNDPVGARSLLEEVMEEGSASQRQRAQDLMRQVA